MSKYTQYLDRIVELLLEGHTKAEISRRIKEEFNLSESEDTIRKAVAREAGKVEAQGSLEDFCRERGIDVKNVKSYWYKDEQFSLNVSNTQDVKTIEDYKDEIIDAIKEFRPKFEKPKYKKSEDGHCLVLDPADVHIGKLSDSFETGCDYNSQVAVRRVKEGVRGILQKASGFDIEQIVFVGGNDILHIDSPRRTTTSGTPQDTDGMWFRNFMIAKQLYIDLIGSLLKIAPVHFVFNPSNHDYTHGFFLADMVTTYFEKHKGFTADADLKHRKYYQYGSNLIATTHGDGAKTADLPLLCATEAPTMWAGTQHRYIYTHHVHHKVAKDFAGIVVESLRSPSGTDSWHHRNGYQHAPKAVEGYLHHLIHGQVARLTHMF